MKPSFLALALAAVAACGRDALVGPTFVSTVTLTCPFTGDETAGSGGARGLLLSQGQAKVPVAEPCSFPEPQVSEAEALEALVRLVTGAGDPMRARTFADKGLKTRLVADRGTVINALLVDTSVATFSDRSMATWLELPVETPSADRISSALWQDALNQTFLQGRAVFVDGNKTLASLVNGSSTFINANLAAVYKVTSPSDSGFAETKVPPLRPGVFGHLSVLTSQPAVSLRGDLLLKAALGCSGAPPPPQGTPVHEVKPSKLAARAALEKQIVEPSCTGCHQLLKAGFLLHRFDERGVLRSVDSDGSPLDTRATVNINEGSQLTLDGLPAFAKALESDGAWVTCLAAAMVKVAEERASLPLKEGTCERAEAVAAALRQQPTIKAVLPVLATTLFGGRTSGLGSNDGPAPPEDPPSPSLEIDGQLSRCTPISSTEMTCADVCQDEAQQCGDHTCRLGSTLGGAFFFSSQSLCGRNVIASTLDGACAGGFREAACTASAPLTWVRCCCGN